MATVLTCGGTNQNPQLQVQNISSQFNQTFVQGAVRLILNNIGSGTQLNFNFLLRNSTVKPGTVSIASSTGGPFTITDAAQTAAANGGIQLINAATQYGTIYTYNGTVGVGEFANAQYNLNESFGGITGTVTFPAGASLVDTATISLTYTDSVSGVSTTLKMATVYGNDPCLPAPFVVTTASVSQYGASVTTINFTSINAALGLPGVYINGDLIASISAPGTITYANNTLFPYAHVAYITSIEFSNFSGNAFVFVSQLPGLASTATVTYVNPQISETIGLKAFTGAATYTYNFTNAAVPTAPASLTSVLVNGTNLVATGAIAGSATLSVAAQLTAFAAALNLLGVGVWTSTATTLVVTGSAPIFGAMSVTINAAAFVPVLTVSASF